MFFVSSRLAKKGHYGKFNATKFKEIWVGSTLSKFRKNLLEGKRCNKPCSDCNANGTLLGKDHAVYGNQFTIFRNLKDRC